MTDQSPKKKKILVADDDPAIRHIVTMILSRQGFEVITAQDGEEAFQKAVMEKPVALLLDIRMPKMDGLELCSKLKATKTTAAIPVAFLTAVRDLDTYRNALDQGGVLYITKPFKPDRLAECVALLLSARQRPATS